jgi:hypothetical protein
MHCGWDGPLPCIVLQGGRAEFLAESGVVILDVKVRAARINKRALQASHGFLSWQFTRFAKNGTQ